MYRYIFLAILTLSLIYDIILSVLSDRQKNKPLPENVRDVYDETEYKRWRAYSAEHKRVATIDGIISSLSTISTPRNAATPAPAVSEAPVKEAEKPVQEEIYAKAEEDEVYTESEEESVPSKKKGKSSSASLITLALSTFFGVVIVCTLLFTVLYSTVLYKSVDVPVLDNLLGVA